MRREYPVRPACLSDRSPLPQEVCVLFLTQIESLFVKLGLPNRVPLSCVKLRVQKF